MEPKQAQKHGVPELPPPVDGTDGRGGRRSGTSGDAHLIGARAITPVSVMKADGASRGVDEEGQDVERAMAQQRQAAVLEGEEKRGGEKKEITSKKDKPRAKGKE